MLGHGGFDAVIRRVDVQLGSPRAEGELLPRQESNDGGLTYRIHWSEHGQLVNVHQLKAVSESDHCRAAGSPRAKLQDAMRRKA